MNDYNAIVVHDFFEFKGGGERLVDTLCRELDLDLAYGYRSEKSYEPGKLKGRVFDLKERDGADVMGWRTLRRFKAFRTGTKFLEKYKTVIYSGIYAPLAVHNHLSGRNIYYCYTPPRFLYDLNSHYLSALPFWRRIPLFNTHLLFFKPLYEEAVKKMDVIIADSNNVKKRIQKYLGRESTVVYPPCDVESFKWRGQEDYYLSTARLIPLKRVELIVEAFLRLPEKRLVVTSDGPEYERLKSRCEGKKNITFTGSVDDRQLKKLIGNAIATLYIPINEDFGMSPVESMSAGKPVLGVSEGGLLETVVHGETGILMKADPSQEDVINAVCEMGPDRAMSMRKACEERARIFREEVFLENMKKVIFE